MPHQLIFHGYVAEGKSFIVNHCLSSSMSFTGLPSSTSEFHRLALKSGTVFTVSQASLLWTSHLSTSPIYPWVLTPITPLEFLRRTSNSTSMTTDDSSHSNSAPLPVVPSWELGTSTWLHF